MTPIFFLIIFMHAIHPWCTRSNMKLTRSVFWQFTNLSQIHCQFIRMAMLLFWGNLWSGKEHPIYEFDNYPLHVIKVDNFTFLSLYHVVCYNENLLYKKIITWRKRIARIKSDFCSVATKPLVAKSGAARKWPMHFFRILHSNLS